MMPWRQERDGVPPWNELPKCHCGFRAWLQVCEDNRPRRKRGCRFFKCPDNEDNFMACTLMEWIDALWPRQLETKAQYYGRMEAAQDTACAVRLEEERRVRQREIRLKGKVDQLQRRREELGAREATLKRQEEEFEARQAQLLEEEERQKKMKQQEAESSSKTSSKGKLPRFTQYNVTCPPPIYIT
uniref:Zinc finger GRF-type domain-containing protein n=1 Tax=Setaria viridis TaxID=4556 RepID=A0A4U6TKL4_SETVI|nr:hypothetical protein SEVIR_7G042000v2 [Setaria viridis]